MNRRILEWNTPHNLDIFEIVEFSKKLNVITDNAAIPALLFCFYTSCMELYRRSLLICLRTWRVEARNIIKCLRNGK